MLEKILILILTVLFCCPALQSELEATDQPLNLEKDSLTAEGSPSSY